MVIVGDVIGDNEEAIDRQVEKIKQISLEGNGETFIAKTPGSAPPILQERSKTSAISKHTNAFKLNEDVVIPLDKIGEYTDACERF